MAKPTTTTPESTTLAPVDQGSALAVARALILEVPQVDEDPTERMAAFILSQPLERHEELWAGLPNVKDNAGEIFTVHDIRARESDYEGGLGLYLIADITWRPSGKKDLLACSSQMAMLQLITARRDNRFPATFEIVRKEKATKRGFHPIHLRYIVNYRDPVVSEQ